MFYVSVIPITSVARQVALTAEQSRAGAVFYVSVIPTSVSRLTAVKQGRTELARCFMLVLFLLVSGQLCSAPCTLLVWPH